MNTNLKEFFRPTNKSTLYPIRKSKISNGASWLILGAVILMAGAAIWREWSLTSKITEPIEIPQIKHIDTEITDTSDSSSKASATENWKTYRNEEYGFEVRYPLDWDIKNENTPLCDFGPSGDNEVVCVEQVLEISPTDIDNSAAWFTVVKTDCETLGDNKWNLSPGPDGTGNDGAWSKLICDRGFSIEIALFNDNPKRELHKQILDQILSTFRFIE